MAAFERASYKSAFVQVLNTWIPALALFAAMLATCRTHYAITLLLAIPASGFFVRLFVLQHDCGHGSFVPSALGNHVIGTISSLFTLTPYFGWRLNHATHHAWSGNLDRRVAGAEFYTMTIEEYARLSPRKRLAYRIYRSPWLLLCFGGFFAFVIENRRFSSVSGKWRRRDRLSVWFTNVGLVAIAWLVGFDRYAMVYAPIVMIAGTAGVLLFYAQHQFERGYFVRGERWSHVDAALQGSSFFALPKVLAFFTANIGYHHVHHLSPRIPNYRLVACHAALGSDARPEVIRMGDVPRLLTLALWDEGRQQLVSFKDSGVAERP